MSPLPALHPLADGCPPAWASGWGQDKYGAWVEFSIGDVTQRMHWIRPGRFVMGSSEDEVGRNPFFAEGSQHEVTLTQGFWMFDTACTQALWEAVMGDNPSEFKEEDRPVENVSWDDCQGFIKRINEKIPGLDLGLPTEAQWEYACRAGTTTPFSFGENITPEQVNYNGNYPFADGPKGEYRQETVPVASLPPNPWGLYEMHGNVWEWCLDGLRDYCSEKQTDPKGSMHESAHRVVRGGSWGDGASVVRSAFRFAYVPGYRSNHVGFRCLRVQQDRAGN